MMSPTVSNCIWSATASSCYPTAGRVQWHQLVNCPLQAVLGCCSPGTVDEVMRPLPPWCATDDDLAACLFSRPALVTAEALLGCWISPDLFGDRSPGW